MWSPPCGSAVHVLGSKIRTRFSPGRRPGAGVRGPVSVVRRPASGVRGKCPGAGIRRPGAASVVRHPTLGFRFRSSEVRGSQVGSRGGDSPLRGPEKTLPIRSRHPSTSLGTPASMLSQVACSMRLFEHHSQTGQLTPIPGACRRSVPHMRTKGHDLATGSLYKPLMHPPSTMIHREHFGENKQGECGAERESASRKMLCAIRSRSLRQSSVAGAH